MPPIRNYGSLSKEVPLAKIDATIRAITPNMRYSELLRIGRTQTHRDAPGLVRQRFILVDNTGTIVYDRFLSLVASEGITSRVRKIMYFVWAFRDDRVRRFILERIVDAAGKWRVDDLTNKANADFFTQTNFEESTAAKVRSNIEFFFVESEILDLPARAIHLELDDGWLPEAVQVAAQHEGEAAVRRGMAAGPVQFLVAKQWNGLANATISELIAIEHSTSAEPEPFEDRSIEVAVARRAPSRPWRARTITTLGRASTTIIVDEVARERASMSHQALERLLAQAASAVGYAPQANAHIDLYFQMADGSILGEVKSCHQNNLHSQVRRGVSQLLEYRFVYSDELVSPVSLLLVIETPPSARQQWLAEFLESLVITLCWREPNQDRLITTATIPPALAGLISPAR